MSLISRILDTAARVPDRLALESLADGRRWTYADLAGEIDRVAGALRQLGAGEGDRVTAQVGSSPEAFLLHLGALRAGVILNPLNPAYTPSEVAFFLADAEPVVFLVDADPDDALRAAVPGGTSIHVLGSLWRSDDTRTVAPVEMSADAVAVLLYTSGTTGRSKGAMITDGNLVACADGLRQAWGITGDDTILHALPLYHVHGLFVATHPFLLTGGTILLAGRFATDTVVEHLPRATVMMGVPTMYVRLLADERVDAELTAHMRLFTSGSAPLLERTWLDWADRTGHRIVERYGMTEIQMACSNPLDGDRRPGTVGVPLPQVEVRVRGDNGELVGPGVPGVLEVRGPNVLAGYWRLAEATRESFTEDGWFITGDVVTRAEDGYVTIVGREKDLVISGGLNVYPKEVEDVIDPLPGVVESAVIGVAHPDFGEAVVAVCAVGEGPEVDGQSVIAACRERLAHFKVPKAVVSVATLPRNTMGKVQKGELRQRFGDMFGS